MPICDMIEVSPAYYNSDSDDQPVGYYIDFPMRVTVYIGQRKGTWWKPNPEISLFIRHE